jgi:hypothetical protein
MIRKIAFKPTKNWQVKEKCTVVMKKRSFGLVRTFLQKSRTTIDACSKTCIIALNKKNNKYFQGRSRKKIQWEVERGGGKTKTPKKQHFFYLTKISVRFFGRKI